MTSLFPRETHPEALFQKILSQPQAKARLYETFCAELEDYTDTEGLVSRTMPYGLLPLKEFEHRLLHHLEQIDGIALACRESMFRLAGSDSLPL